ncbi:class I adenylate-forming enzyme family protein [Azospirillum sp.]|uniref:class I adenylate-forming enzyme family protein n=1 Tax=Azospirillum sp. TaxID=34012 RepID=UPI002D4D9006|nr:AMP-binding protein [Azospirillum sp.]HYD71211.1 AMP-binding protein [Azospirillum sp.]
MSSLSILGDPPPARISDLPARWARETPDAPAYETSRGTVTWGAVGAAIERAADVLREAGVRPGDRVMIVNENGIAGVVLLFAVSRLDAWASLVNARMSAREVAAMRAHAGFRRVLFTVEDSAAAAEHAAAEPVTTHDDPVFGRIAMGTLDESCTPEPVRADGEQIALLMYTSGTTGNPKAVMLAHRAVMYTGASQCKARRLTAADRLYVVAPLSHSIGVSSNVLAAAWVGACSLLPPRFDPAHLAASIRDGKVSFIVAVPQVFARLLDYAAAKGIELRSPALRCIGCGGAPLDPNLKERVSRTLGLPFGNGYGATEMVPVARVPDGVDVAGDVIGEPSPGVEIRLVRDDGSEAPDGAVGELWVRGPSLMSGYFRNEAATREVMRPGGWLATGDLGCRDAQGYYRIVGRSKELIIRSGFNVYPVEVESVLGSHPAVAQSAVVGRTLEGNEEVVAYVQCQPGRLVSEAELLEHLRANLAPYKVPSEIVVTELPIGPTGKILKSALKSDAQNHGHGATLR